MVGAAATLALLLAAEGDRGRALELAILIERHPTEAPAARKRASQLAAELLHQIPEEDGQLIQQRNRARTLEDVLAIVASHSGGTGAGDQSL